MLVITQCFLLSPKNKTSFVSSLAWLDYLTEGYNSIEWSLMSSKRLISWPWKSGIAKLASGHDKIRIFCLTKLIFVEESFTEPYLI